MGGSCSLFASLRKIEGATKTVTPIASPHNPLNTWKFLMNVRSCSDAQTPWMHRIPVSFLLLKRLNIYYQPITRGRWFDPCFDPKTSFNSSISISLMLVLSNPGVSTSQIRSPSSLSSFDNWIVDVQDLDDSPTWR